MGIKSEGVGGRIAQWIAYLLHTQLGLILGIPNSFSLDVAEFYWRHCLEQWKEAW